MTTPSPVFWQARKLSGPMFWTCFDTIKSRERVYLDAYDTADEAEAHLFRDAVEMIEGGLSHEHRAEDGTVYIAFDSGRLKGQKARLYVSYECQPHPDGLQF